jgi:hypothetical protein
MTCVKPIISAGVSFVNAEKCFILFEAEYSLLLVFAGHAGMLPLKDMKLCADEFRRLDCRGEVTGSWKAAGRNHPHHIGKRPAADRKSAHKQRVPP